MSFAYFTPPPRLSGFCKRPGAAFIAAGIVAVLAAGFLAFASFWPAFAQSGSLCAGSAAVSAYVPSTATSTPIILDCNALLAAKDDLRGTATLNWSKDLAMAQWNGLSVAPQSAQARVIKLRLNNAGLNGSIPARLGNLTGLAMLELEDNTLTGSIPAALGGLTELTRLSLSRNTLSGGIPKELGQLSRLETLNLDSNYRTDAAPGLTGSIPAELGQLSRLESLNLSSNRLTGAVPSALGQLSALGYLNLSRNRLDSPLPPELGGLSQLTTLYLRNNRLAGPCPPKWAG